MDKWLKTLAFSSLITFSSLSANQSVMISAEEAIKLIGTKNVVFVNGDSPDAFAVGHIEGSVNMEAHHLKHTDGNGVNHCEPMFSCVDYAEKFISDHGVDNDDLVIAYDNYAGPNASGVYHYFRSWGHTNVKMLNGGSAQIKKLDPNQMIYNDLKAQKKVNKKLYKTAKKAYKADKTPANKEVMNKYKAIDKEFKAKMKKVEKTLLVQKGQPHHAEGHHSYDIVESKINHKSLGSKAQMMEAVNDIEKNGKNSKYRIIDTRRFAEIMGSGKIDNVARGGHIPGSTFIEWKNLTDFDKKLSYKSLSELQEVFDRYGIKKEHEIYAYCHVGAGRSTHIGLALERLGYPNITVYTGSWDEWGNDMNLPNRR